MLWWEWRCLSNTRRGGQVFSLLQYMRRWHSVGRSYCKFGSTSSVLVNHLRISRYLPRSCYYTHWGLVNQYSFNEGFAGQNHCRIGKSFFEKTVTSLLETYYYPKKRGTKLIEGRHETNCTGLVACGASNVDRILPVFYRRRYQSRLHALK